MDNCNYEKEQMVEIQKWKDEVPNVITRAFGVALEPLSRLAQKVVPESAIKGALDFSNYAAQWLTDVNDIKRDAHVCEISELKYKGLKLSDELANDVHNWAIGIAAVEGGAAGFFGLPGMAIDIPAIITIGLRTIHKIGICYGFEAKTYHDKNFILAIMAASGANSIEEKTAALLVLRQIEVAIATQTWKAMGIKAAQNNMCKEGAIIAVKNLAKQLGVNISKRKALESIPVFGCMVGSSVNGWFIKEIGWAARRSFQERWLIEKYKTIDLEQEFSDEENKKKSAL